MNTGVYFSDSPFTRAVWLLNALGGEQVECFFFSVPLNVFLFVHLFFSLPAMLGPPPQSSIL